jgi:hypothetical protein
LSIAAVLFIMVFDACGSSFKYNSDCGLRRHQLNCQEFHLAENEASHGTVDDALEEKKQKAAPSLGEVSLTGLGSGVRDAFIFYFLYSSIIVGCIRGYRHGR